MNPGASPGPGFRSKLRGIYRKRLKFYFCTLNLFGTVVEAPPCTGAKLSFLIDDKLEDREWISNLIRITYKELPEQIMKGVSYCELFLDQ